jgi:hypothetical protein
VHWTDFWWVIPHTGGSTSKPPLFDECHKFLKSAESLKEDSKRLFNEIHAGHPFKLPPW